MASRCQLPSSRIPFARGLAGVLVASAILMLAGCGVLDPFDTTFRDVEPARTYEAERLQPAEPPSGGVDVATWNIKYGGARIEFFWECPGERVNMTESEVVSNLREIAAAISKINADVLLLQEVDVDAKRAAFVDQVQWLLDHSRYNYGVYASQWKADYVPSDGIGRMDSGNAILSVWPIEDAKRIALPLIDEQGALTQYFWLRRNILDARIDVPGDDEFRVLGTHTAAFAEDDTTARQIERFADRVAMHDEAGRLVVAGGDLNTIPPGTEKRSNFRPDPPEECELDGSDYAAHEGWTDPLYDAYQSAVPLEDYRRDNDPYFTFTGQADGFWNRKLDYLFTNGSFQSESTVTYQNAERGGIETMPLSDHAPVSTRLVFPGEHGEAGGGS